MNDESPAVRQIDWRGLFPWLMLLRTTRFALAPTSLIIATLGLAATTIGWGLAARLILGNQLEENVRIADEVIVLRAWPQPLAPGLERLPQRTDTAFVQPFITLTAPVRRLFALEALSFRELAFYTLGILWTFAVWAAAGGFIVRSALVRYAWDQPADPWQTLQFVIERYFSYFSAPLYPLFGVALLTIPLLIAGLLARSDFGALFIALFWFVGLLAALGAVWLLVPLLFGFPLMWGAISAERDGDAFEALSNSMAYTYQRPLRFLGYVLLLVVLGGLSVIVVDGIAWGIVHFGYWGLSWGSGTERAIQLRLLAEQGAIGWPGPNQPSRVLEAAGWLMGMWTGLVYLLAAGFRYSFFWSGAAGIYLLLRKDVDDKEIDEVYVPHEEPHFAPVTRQSAQQPTPNTAPPPIPPPTAAPSPPPSAAATADPPPEAPKQESSDIAPA